MNRKMKLITFISVLVLSMVLSACGASENTSGTSEGNDPTSVSNSTGNEEAYINKNYSFSSGQPSGVMYPTSVAITDLLTKHTSWNADMNIFPGGGLSNIINTQNGKAQFGISYSSAVVSALKGEEPFGTPHDKISNGASLFSFYSHFVTLKDSDIKTVEDLKGKKVNLGTKGQASRLVAEAIFKVHGMSEGDLAEATNLSYSDAFQQLKDGQLDALFLQQNAPYSGFQELAMTVGIDLIPIDEGKLAELKELNPGMIPSVIKAGTYEGIDEDIHTVKTPLSLVLSKDLPEQLVYDMVKSFDEHFEDFQSALPPLKSLSGPDEFATDIGLEFHPGAKKYYEEKGWIK